MPHDCTVVVPTAGPSGNQVYDDAIEKMDDADGAMGAPQASPFVRRFSGQVSGEAQTSTLKQSFPIS
jgi:hypothetical protein